MTTPWPWPCLQGFADSGIPTYGDIISRCDVDIPKGVRLHGEYLQRFLAGDIALVLLADSTIYGLCKGSTCVDYGTGYPFVHYMTDSPKFANLYGLDIAYALRHGKTVVLRIDSTNS